MEAAEAEEAAAAEAEAEAAEEAEEVEAAAWGARWPRTCSHGSAPRRRAYISPRSPLDLP